jgi:hypothetical protein
MRCQKEVCVVGTKEERRKSDEPLDRSVIVVTSGLAGMGWRKRKWSSQEAKKNYMCIRKRGD